MSTAIYRESVLDVYGNPIPGASVAIYESDGTTLAHLWTNEAGSVALANPLPIGVAVGAYGLDTRANMKFRAAAGQYVMKITVGGNLLYSSEFDVIDAGGGGGGGGATQIFELAADKTCPGHQAGIILANSTFVATSENMRAEIFWSATVLGGSKCALTWHVGKKTPAGGRISRDLVDRSTVPTSQGPLPGVTDYREKLFPIAVDPESVPGSASTVIDLPSLDVGETYTFEIKWGFLSGSKNALVGTVPIRIATDAIPMRGVVTNFLDGTVSVFSVGTWQWWQAAPGLYEAGGFVPVGYEAPGAGSSWPVTVFASPAVGLFPYGCDIAVQPTQKYRALIGCVGDNKLYLIDMLSALVLAGATSAALAADIYDVAFFPGTLPTQAVCVTDDGHLRIVNVQDTPAISQAVDINVGVSGRTCAANFSSGSNVAVWHGSLGTNPIRLRGFDTAGTAINPGGLAIQALSGDVTRIRRITTGPNAETLLVATTRGAVVHVSADGSTVLGTFLHPDGTSTIIVDIDESPDGVLCYGTTSSGFFYFWLPNTVGGPAYQLFDVSGVGGTPQAICVTANEDVLLTRADKRVLSLPGGAAFCRPSNLLTAESLKVAFTES